MKTIFFPELKKSHYLLMGILSIVITSCGSYQNTSYYDRDGIYGGSNPQRKEVSNTTSSPNNSQYKDYFGSLQDHSDRQETFSDVENYSSSDYSNENNNQGYNASNSDWGNRADNVNINIYGGNLGWNSGWNNYWGWNLGWGWNSWYGPSYYGWGWDPWYNPYYSWGWNSWYGNSYYPGYTNYYQPYRHGIRSFNGNHLNQGYSYSGRRYSDTASGGRRGNNTGVRTSNTRSGDTRYENSETYNTVRTPRTNVRTQSSAATNNTNYNSGSNPRPIYNTSTRTQPSNTRSGNNTYSSGSGSSSYGGSSGSSRSSGRR